MSRRDWLLLVEDDAWQAELYKEALEDQLRIMVKCAEGAEPALKLLDQPNTPKLLLLDLFLAQHNGIELIHELASYEDTARIPIILISNLNFSDLGIGTERLKHYGVVDYIDKTVTTPQNVAARVAAHLSVAV